MKLKKVDSVIDQLRQNNTIAEPFLRVFLVLNVPEAYLRSDSVGKHMCLFHNHFLQNGMKVFLTITWYKKKKKK